MHVAIINSLYAPYSVGGAEKSVQLLAESLANQGNRVTIITLGEEAAAYLDNGVDIRRLRLSNVSWPFGTNKPFLSRAGFHIFDIFNLLMLKKVQSTLLEVQPDIVHTNNVSGFSVAVWKAAKKMQLPIVHTLRDYHLLCLRSSMYRNASKCETQCLDCSCASRLKKKASYGVNHVIGISRSILDRHLSFGLFPDSRKSVIFNTVNSDVQQSDKGIPDSLTFGFIGRLSPEKGVALLLSAFGHSEVCNRARLVVAGEGDPGYVEGLKKSVAANSQIDFVGRVAADDFYRKIDVLICPSIWEEPFGRVVVEAHAAGIPVIGTELGGIPEIIDEGKTGYVVSPNEEEALVAAMLQFIHNPDTIIQMAPVCLHRAKRFSPDAISQCYLEVYKQAIYK